MSYYDEISEEFDVLFKDKDVDLDYFDEDSAVIIVYGEEVTQEVLSLIEDEWLDRFKGVLVGIIHCVGTKRSDDSYYRLEYKCNIGEDEKTEDELMQDEEDYKIDQSIRLRKGD